MDDNLMIYREILAHSKLYSRYILYIIYFFKPRQQVRLHIPIYYKMYTNNKIQ